MKKFVTLIILAVLLCAGQGWGAVLLEETFEGSNSGYDNAGWAETEADGDENEVSGDIDADQTATGITGYRPNWGDDCAAVIITNILDDAYTEYTLSADAPIAYTKIEYIYKEGAINASGSCQIGKLLDSSDAQCWALNLYNDGGTLKFRLIVLKDGAAATTLTSDTTLPVAGTIYRHEILWDTTSGSRKFIWKINGILEDQDLTDGNFTAGIKIPRKLRLGGITFQITTAYTAYCDNVVIDSADWPGITPIDPDNIEIGVLGDPHYTNATTYGLDRCEDLTDYIAWYNTQSIDLLITDGDTMHQFNTQAITDDFSACVLAAAPKYPFMLTVGNHDGYMTDGVDLYGNATTAEIQAFIDDIIDYDTYSNKAELAKIPARNWSVNIGDTRVVSFDNANSEEAVGDDLYLACTATTLAWLEAELADARTKSKKVVLVAHAPFDYKFPGNPVWITDESSMCVVSDGTLIFASDTGTVSSEVPFTSDACITADDVGYQVVWNYDTDDSCEEEISCWTSENVPSHGWGTVLSFADGSGVMQIDVPLAGSGAVGAYAPLRTYGQGDAYGANLMRSKVSSSAEDIQTIIEAQVNSGLEIVLAIAGHSHNGNVAELYPITRTYTGGSVQYYVTHATHQGYFNDLPNILDLGIRYVLTVTPTGFAWSTYPSEQATLYPASETYSERIKFTDTSESTDYYYGTWKQAKRNILAADGLNITIAQDDIIDGQGNTFDLGGKFTLDASGAEGSPVIFKRFIIDLSDYAATDCLDTAGFDHWTIQQCKFDGAGIGVKIDSGSTNIATVANTLLSATGIQNNSATAITSYNDTFYGTTIAIDANEVMAVTNDLFWNNTADFSITAEKTVTGDYNYSDLAVPAADYTDGGHGFWSQTITPFVSATDFRLKPISPCVDSGTYIAALVGTLDIYDKLFPSATDEFNIGASQQDPGSGKRYLVID